METQIDWALILAFGQKFLLLAASLGVVIDMTPGIKLQPVRWLLNQLGRQLNKEMYQDLKELKGDFEEHKIDSQRYEILEFANSCMNRRKHTKEEFDHIIKVHDSYENYCHTKNIENGQVKVAYAYIEKVCMQCMDKNSFLHQRADCGEQTGASDKTKPDQ
jgi:hypothetical protein